jgi:hypothetical protein
MADFLLPLSRVSFLGLTVCRSCSSGLRVLYVDSPHAEGPGPVHALLHAASEQCPSLTHLTIVCKVSPDAASHQPTPADCISFAELNPLLAYPHLVHFELAHRYPLDLAQADVATLARSWPALEMLVLNVDPALLSPPGLTLHCSLTYGVVWEMEAADSDGVRVLAAEVHARCARWRRVEELLPLLTRLRAERSGCVRRRWSKSETICARRCGCWARGAGECRWLSVVVVGSQLYSPL